MCRLTAYIGTPIVAADLVTRPNHSIITQVGLDLVACAVLGGGVEDGRDSR